MRRWRESPLSTTIAWVARRSSSSIVASRTMINTRVPNVGEFLPLPASARDWWADFTSAWNPGGLGVDVANPTVWGVLSIASVLWLFHQGLGLTVLVVGLVRARRLGHVAPGHGLPVEPGPHRRPRRLRGAAARAGRDLDRAPQRARRLRRGAVVRAPAPRRRRHRHRRSRRRPPPTSSTACSTCSSRERIRRTAMLTIADGPRRRPRPGRAAGARGRHRRARRLTTLAANAGMRTAGLDGGPRPRRVRRRVGAQPAVVDDVVVERPRRRRRSPARRDAASPTSPRWPSAAAVRAPRAGPLRAGPRSPCSSPGHGA